MNPCGQSIHCPSAMILESIPEQTGCDFNTLCRDGDMKESLAPYPAAFSVSPNWEYYHCCTELLETLYSFFLTSLIFT